MRFRLFLFLLLAYIPLALSIPAPIRAEGDTASCQVKTISVSTFNEVIVTAESPNTPDQGGGFPSDLNNAFYLIKDPNDPASPKIVFQSGTDGVSPLVTPIVQSNGFTEGWNFTSSALLPKGDKLSDYTVVVNDAAGTACNTSTAIIDDHSQVAGDIGGTNGNTSNEPTDPCSKYTTGSADYNRCTAQIKCSNRVDAVNKATGKSAGYVFLPAFGNACNNLTEFFATAFNYIMLFATLIAGFMFAKGMFGILVSRGNPAAVADAREMLTNAVIGLVLLATAFLIIKFLNGAFQAVPGSGINLSPIDLSPWSQ